MFRLPINQLACNRSAIPVWQDWLSQRFALRATTATHIGYIGYGNPIWIVRRIPQESFSQQPFSLYNSFRIAIYVMQNLPDRLLPLSVNPMVSERRKLSYLKQNGYCHIKRMNQKKGWSSIGNNLGWCGHRAH